MNNRATFPAVACMFGVLLAGPVAQGQQEIASWLDPRMGERLAENRYRSRFFCDEGVKRQSATMGFAEYDLYSLRPISQSERHEWTFSSRLGWMDFHGGARFPATGDQFPGNLVDLRFATAYRHGLDDGKILGASLSVGSASDEPFASAGETTASVTGFLRTPHREHNAWFFFVHFSNELDELRYPPLPGVGYHYVQMRKDAPPKFQALIGVPLAWVKYQPLEPLTLEASVLVPKKAHAGASYQIVKNLRLHAGYDWDSRRFIRHDRVDDDDRLFYYAQRVSGGLRWDITDELWVDVSGGYGFNRFFFEGENHEDRDDNRLSIGDGPFAGVQIGLRF